MAPSSLLGYSTVSVSPSFYNNLEVLHNSVLVKIVIVLRVILCYFTPEVSVHSFSKIWILRWEMFNS